MKVIENDVPREFTVKGVTLKDCARIKLDYDEMVTFVTPSGREYDFTAKSFGFYITQSVNNRMAREGFKTALTMNPEKRVYIQAVEKDKIGDFMDYLNEQDGTLLCWLDEWMNMQQEKKKI